MSTWGKNYQNQFSNKGWELETAKGKLETYCAYQERCPWDIRKKLFEKGIRSEDVEPLIDDLIHKGFLDEGRFSCAFARGKFRIKKWGKIRITRELRRREINSIQIIKALKEIDPVEYFDTLLSLTEKRWEKTKEKDLFKKRYLVMQFLNSKGFEEDLIREAIQNIQSK